MSILHEQHHGGHDFVPNATRISRGPIDAEIVSSDERLKEFDFEGRHYSEGDQVNLVVDGDDQAELRGIDRIEINWITGDGKKVDVTAYDKEGRGENFELDIKNVFPKDFKVDHVNANGKDEIDLKIGDRFQAGERNIHVIGFSQDGLRVNIEKTIKVDGAFGGLKSNSEWRSIANLQSHIKEAKENNVFDQIVVAKPAAEFKAEVIHTEKIKPKHDDGGTPVAFSVDKREEVDEQEEEQTEPVTPINETVFSPDVRTVEVSRTRPFFSMTPEKQVELVTDLALKIREYKKGPISAEDLAVSLWGEKNLTKEHIEEADKYLQMAVDAGKLIAIGSDGEFEVVQTEEAIEEEETFPNFKDFKIGQTVKFAPTPASFKSRKIFLEGVISDIDSDLNVTIKDGDDEYSVPFGQIFKIISEAVSRPDAEKVTAPEKISATENVEAKKSIELGNTVQFVDLENNSLFGNVVKMTSGGTGLVVVEKSTGKRFMITAKKVQRVLSSEEVEDREKQLAEVKEKEAESFAAEPETIFKPEINAENVESKLELKENDVVWYNNIKGGSLLLGTVESVNLDTDVIWVRNMKTDTLQKLRVENIDSILTTDEVNALPKKEVVEVPEKAEAVENMVEDVVPRDETEEAAEVATDETTVEKAAEKEEDLDSLEGKAFEKLQTAREKYVELEIKYRKQCRLRRNVFYEARENLGLLLTMANRIGAPEKSGEHIDAKVAYEKSLLKYLQIRVRQAKLDAESGEKMAAMQYEGRSTILDERELVAQLIEAGMSSLEKGISVKALEKLDKRSGRKIIGTDFDVPEVEKAEQIEELEKSVPLSPEETVEEIHHLEPEPDPVPERIPEIIPEPEIQEVVQPKLEREIFSAPQPEIKIADETPVPIEEKIEKPTSYFFTDGLGEEIEVQADLLKAYIYRKGVVIASASLKNDGSIGKISLYSEFKPVPMTTNQYKETVEFLNKNKTLANVRFPNR